MTSFDPQWRLLARTPANAVFLDELEPLPRHRDGSHREPYMEAGAHPDVVSYLWDKLNPLLPEDCRYIAVAKPVLARPDNGRIFAVASGTQWWIWLPELEHARALELGLKPDMTWFGGTITNLEELYGPGWLFGRYQPLVSDWVVTSYDCCADPRWPY